ncbi:MAG: lysylphosphatidylglycerol synthase domain-containing protein, partial [Candidatus Binatia bacterium]
GTIGSLTAYRRSGRLPELVALSVAAQAVVVAVVHLLARAVGIERPLSDFFVIVPLVSLVESIPVSVYGIGLRDVSYVYLLGLGGTAKEQALSLSVLYVVVSLLYGLCGGVVFALRRSRTGARA